MPPQTAPLRGLNVESIQKEATIMDRTIRIAGEMQRALSEIIQFDMKDPRIPPVTGVTKVKLTKDLQFAKVYVSIFAAPEEKMQAIHCLAASEGFIRSMLGKRMIIRQLPRLTFRLDNSAEEGEAMSKRIDEVIRRDAEVMAGSGGADNKTGEAAESGETDETNEADETADAADAAGAARTAEASGTGEAPLEGAE